MPGLAAVTGATGFIGRNLLKSLHARGWRVRALTRLPRRNEAALEWVTGTLDDPGALDRLLDGATAVVHLAGRVRGRSLDEFLRSNVEGTINLVEAAKRRQAGRLLLVSSLAAREPDLSWYARSKYLGEQALKDHAAGIDCAVFRPTAVYGPGDREMKPLFGATRWRLLPVTGSAASRFGLLHVDDLVEAILLWLEAAAPPGGVYELDDGMPGGYDARRVAEIAAGVWKHPVHLLPLPVILVRMVAGINLRLAHLLHYSPMLTPGKLRELLHPDWVCDNTALTGALGWKPTRTLSDELSAAVLPVDDSRSGGL